MEKLAGKKIAVLVANGFEETHMTDCQKALIAVGAQVKLVSPELNLVNGWHETAWGHFFPVDVAIANALASDYDALLVPGGFRGLERLRKSAHTNRIVKGFIDSSKPTAMVGHAQLLLADVERVEGRTLAGGEDTSEKLSAATFAEDEVVVDGALLTAKDGVDGEALKDKVLAHFDAVLGGDLASAA